jgi:hypothetical protein
MKGWMPCNMKLAWLKVCVNITHGNSTF